MVVLLCDLTTSTSPARPERVEILTVCRVVVSPNVSVDFWRSVRSRVCLTTSSVSSSPR